jgi:hypothetical protein
MVFPPILRHRCTYAKVIDDPDLLDDDCSGMAAQDVEGEVGRPPFLSL